MKLRTYIVLVVLCFVSCTCSQYTQAVTAGQKTYNAICNNSVEGVKEQLPKKSDYNPDIDEKHIPNHIIQARFSGKLKGNIFTVQEPQLAVLHCAAICNAREVAQYLLQQNVHVDVKSGDAYTPLHLAAYFGSLRTVRLLIDMGANPLAQAGNLFTPIHMAAISDREGTDAVLDFLVRKVDNVDPRSSDDIYVTPLHMAALAYPHPDKVEILLENGADPNIKLKNGTTYIDELLFELKKVRTENVESIEKQFNIPQEDVKQALTNILYISLRSPRLHLSQIDTSGFNIATGMPEIDQMIQVIISLRDLEMYLSHLNASVQHR